MKNPHPLEEALRSEPSFGGEAVAKRIDVAQRMS